MQRLEEPRCDCVEPKLVPICALAKVETVSFGFCSDFSICAVILDSSATSSGALSMSRDNSPRCCERFFAVARSLGGVAQEFGHKGMLA